jgi:hypothetical protein
MGISKSIGWPTYCLFQLSGVSTNGCSEGTSSGNDLENDGQGDWIDCE